MKKKPVNYKNELFKVFDNLSRTYERHRIFDDFLTCAICCYHQTNLLTKLEVKDEANEKLYQETIKNYKKEDLNLFSEALAFLSLEIHENPYTDPLGEYFEEFLYNERLGQFFTPMSLTKLLAEIIVNDKDTPMGEDINDPCCGSGRLSLSFAEINPKHRFFACDISPSLAKLCTLNFFINGLRGEVCWGDTLRVEYKKVWRVNMNGIGILPIEPEQSIGFAVQSTKDKEKPSINPKKAPIKVQHSETKPTTSEQLKLF